MPLWALPRKALASKLSPSRQSTLGTGLAGFFASASLPQAMSQKLVEDVVTLCAACALELAKAGLEVLASWGSVRPVEQCRLPAQLP